MTTAGPSPSLHRPLHRRDNLRSIAAPDASEPVATRSRQGQPWRLRKHADYQRVYKASRKQQSTSMAFFATSRPDLPEHAVVACDAASARVGLTAGKVLGNAVERNRIKRRMRAVVRAHVHLLPVEADVILHPRKQVLTVPFDELTREVEKIFSMIAKRLGTAT